MVVGGKGVTVDGGCVAVGSGLDGVAVGYGGVSVGGAGVSVGRVAADPPCVGVPDGATVPVGEEVPGGFVLVGVVSEPDNGVWEGVGCPWPSTRVEMSLLLVNFGSVVSAEGY